MDQQNRKRTLKYSHNEVAPYWATGLIVLCLTGLSTSWLNFGSFWKGYVLDMTGPTWIYILLRLRYTNELHNWWTQFFTPNKTVILLTVGAFFIEGLQYLKVYDSTFDPFDLIAYISLLIPVYLIDKLLIKS